LLGTIIVANAPKVSILLPSLNQRQFLEPRIESLLNQSFSDWEAIVLDSYSSDGSWEYFQSIASKDSRFRLHRIPAEGVYAALNRGLELVRGEFLYVATCDDTMSPEFLTTMLKALELCPEAGIAACDLLLINRDGNELSAPDLAGHLSRNGIRTLLKAGMVRSALLGQKQRSINYRPPPHDCLLHFSGRSVYFSLTQLLVRASLARQAGPFETTVGSIADFDWVLRLTNCNGSVHVPEKLATWRFHGDQLSVRRDRSRTAATKTMCIRILPAVYQRHYPLLSANDCSTLLLPCKHRVAPFILRFTVWMETAFRLMWMFLEQPRAMVRTIRATRFRIPTVRHSLVPMVLQRMRCVPEPLNGISNR
jgi:glycosyltransferase involved in cell wall biosynthesis